MTHVLGNEHEALSNVIWNARLRQPFLFGFPHSLAVCGDFLEEKFVVNVISFSHDLDLTASRFVGILSVSLV